MQSGGTAQPHRCIDTPRDELAIEPRTAGLMSATTGMWSDRRRASASMELPTMDVGCDILRPVYVRTAVSVAFIGENFAD
jgi:hypothetical protein